ncbi:MAG: hypothetical protein ACRENE_16790 [Polyangiaceae bacterium]
MSASLPRRSALPLAAAASLGLVAACGSRSSYWDHGVDTSVTPYGLQKGVAIVDDVNHQVVALTSTADHSLRSQRLPIGHNFASATPLPDLSSLLLLSAGDPPGAGSGGDPPSLTRLSIAADHIASATRLPMTQPLPNLAVDPLGQYAVAYQGDTASHSFASNPNEIVIFDLLHKPAARSIARSLQSFGSSPQRLTFTPSLNLPAGGPSATARRLLVVETKFDVTIVDLDHAFDPPAQKRPDITVRLSTGTSTATLTPAGVAIDPNPDDGWIAVRTLEDHNVYTMQLIAAAPSAGAPGDGGAATAGDGGVPGGGTPNDFTASPTLTDVGGTPSDIAFVNTSSGVRVAALVPSASQGVLLRPDGNDLTSVVLPSAYSNMSVVTSQVGNAATSPGSAPPDVALLWQKSASNFGGSSAGVALWTLDFAAGQSYRSVEVLTVTDPISSVVDVPPKGALKLLTTPPGSTHSLYVLDLARRTPSPIDTMSTPSVSVSPDGGRFWVFGGTNLASIDLGMLNPTPLKTSNDISSVFDVSASTDPTCDLSTATNAACPRTLVALHATGTFGATLFDALAPTASSPHEEVGLLLEAP